MGINFPLFYLLRKDWLKSTVIDTPLKIFCRKGQMGMAHVLLMGPRHHLPANITVGDAPPHCRHDITSHLDFVLNSHVESLVEIGGFVRFSRRLYRFFEIMRRGLNLHTRHPKIHGETLQLMFVLKLVDVDDVIDFNFGHFVIIPL